MRKRDFNGIMGEVRRHLFRIKSVKRVSTLTDAVVADALGIKPNTFSALKRRDSIPYEIVLEWCVANNIEATSIFYDKKG